ncbi:glycosyltransferase family 2 protein [Salinimicrobium soli]|uniref:glycosyltransferase family 2 protein n=1 Tax=Salinimicrobium soli TaxID=1254399 RepID=UPI003AAD8766
MEKELISIIMPVFNRVDLIGESLDSILQQQYQNWECIVVDDHSTDDTWSVVKEYVRKDNRFRLYKRPESKNKGANSCRNFGLDKANGEYIHWFDSDDIAHPECLAISKRELDNSGKSFCRFGRSVFYGDFDKVVYQRSNNSYHVSQVDLSQLDRILKNHLEFNTCNVLWIKSALGEERFSEDIVYADEWEYYARLILKGLEGVSINKVLFYGRKHAESTTFEFHAADKKRRNSKVKATEMVIINLGEKQLLTDTLQSYFIELGFFLKSKSIINLTLEYSGASFFERAKYKAGFLLYPILRPILKLKGRLKRRVYSEY